MKIVFLIFTIISLTACSNKFTETNSFGGGSNFGNASKKSEIVLPMAAESNEEMVNLDVKKSNLQAFIEPTLGKPVQNIPLKYKSSLIPHNKTTKTTKKTTKLSQKIKSKNLDLWVNNEYPIYSNVSIVLGYLFWIVALAVLFQKGFLEAFRILWYGGHGIITEFFLWAFLGFTQILFANWMKNMVQKSKQGKGLIALLQFIITLTIGTTAILLAIF